MTVHREYAVMIDADTPEDVPSPTRIEEAIGSDLDREAEDGRTYDCFIRVTEIVNE